MIHIWLGVANSFATEIIGLRGYLHVPISMLLLAIKIASPEGSDVKEHKLSAVDDTYMVRRCKFICNRNHWASALTSYSNLYVASCN